jgi:hypothetical protein
LVNTGASFLHTVVATSSCEIWRRFSPTLRFSSNSAIRRADRPIEDAGRSSWPTIRSSTGVVCRPWRAAWGHLPAVESGVGPSTGRGERPGAVCRPWRAAWGRPPAVESDLGPSAGRGERLGAVRRPWRAAWGLPPTVESDLGPSADRGERPGAVRRPRRAPWGRPPAAESGLGPSVGCGEGINVLKINGNKTMNF